MDIASNFFSIAMGFIVTTNFLDTMAEFVVCLPDVFDITVTVIFITLSSAISIYLSSL